MNRKLLVASGILLATCTSPGLWAQTNTELFGQNRIQLRNFDWKYYQSDNVKIYFYDRAGVELSRYIAEQMEKDLAQVQKKMGDIVPNGLDIILYNSYDHFLQTNIGLASNNNIQNNNAGQVNIIGNKLVIYFTGRHEDIKRQLRSGLYSIILQKTLFGESLGDALRNSLVLDLPKWFSEGYLNYMVDGWDSKANSDWKALVMDPKQSKRFEELARHYPTLAGKAFWKYLIEKYGERNVKDFIFIAQNESSLNTATKALAGTKIVPMFDSLVAYYQGVYDNDAASQLDVNAETPLITIENKDPERTISNVKVSPRGLDVAYVAWKHGEFKVLLQKSEKVDGIAKNTISTIVSGGVINHNAKDDPEYPLLAWSNTGYKLGVIFKKYNLTYLRVFDAVKAKVTNYIISERKFDRILSFSFMEDDDMIVFSAIKNGQSDIFEYRMKRSQVNQITDDPYDDLEPVFVSGGSRKGIAFISNRPEPYINIKPLPNELPTGKMRGYFFNTTTKSYELTPLTPDVKGDVFQIIPYGPDNFSYLTNENGVVNRNVVLFKRNEWNKDVAVSIPVTNGNYGIMTHQYNPASKSIADAIKTNNGLNVYFRKVELPAPFGDLQPVNRTQAQLSEEPFLNNSKKDVLMQERQAPARSAAASDRNRVSIDSDGDLLQSRFSKDRDKAVRSEATNSLQSGSDADQQFKDSLKNASAEGRVMYVDSTFIKMRSLKYRRSFKPDFYSVRIDNNQLFTRYQNFSGNIYTPTLGGMLSASLYDKMEDYRFTGGYRLPVFTNGSAYFLQFDNFKKRVDWGLTYYREVRNLMATFVIGTPSGSMLMDYRLKPVLNMVQGYASYPLDMTKSIRLNAGLRQDRNTVKATDVISNYIENEDKYYITSRAEFIHDDTRMKALNIPDGLRLKFYGEYMYKLHDDNIYSSGDSLRNPRGGFFNVGFDIRNYTQVYKNITFAFRAAFAHSGGNEKVLHVLGGVDNALNAKQANYPFGINTYAFQSLTTSLRGYDQNARNGNTFGLINAELRVPVFETFFRKPVQSTIWKHLQAVAFVDVGSAWEGLLPVVLGRSDDRRNVYRVPNIPNAPSQMTITLPYSGDDKLAVGYGLGLRTMIYGYFFRADGAMNINGQFRLHLAMGVDF
ncbi:MAG: hypothetical protein JNM21_07885 [Taibaiella sp.]|nr:hypothetical protein [Taibaiella sp.]